VRRADVAVVAGRVARGGDARAGAVAGVGRAGHAVGAVRLRAGFEVTRRRAAVAARVVAVVAALAGIDGTVATSIEDRIGNAAGAAPAVLHDEADGVRARLESRAGNVAGDGVAVVVEAVGVEIPVVGDDRVGRAVV